METQLYACTSNNKKQQGNNFYFDFPYQNRQFKPNMRLKVLSANCILAGGNENTLILKLHERGANIATPDSDIRIPIAMLTNYNALTSTNATIRNYNIFGDSYEVVVKTNPSRLMFSLFNNDNTTQQTYNNITSVNIMIECTYIDEAEQRKEIFSIQNYPQL